MALICQWFAWPFANSQLQMVLMMLPFIIIGALLFSHRRTMLSGYDCNMVILLALSPHFPYQLDVGHSLSMAFAIVTGPLAGWAAYRFILPVTAQGRLNGLRAMMVHELQDMAAAPQHARDIRVWRARLYHRLLRLVRASEKVGAASVQEAAGLAALRVGKAVLILHTLEGDVLLSESTLRSVRSALQRLQQLPSAPTAAPLLQGLARRIQQRQPEQALQLQLAAQDIIEHQRFCQHGWHCLIDRPKSRCDSGFFFPASSMQPRYP